MKAIISQGNIRTSMACCGMMSRAIAKHSFPLMDKTIDKEV
jgi:hypothetical protein